MRVNFCANTEVNTLYFSDVHSKTTNVRTFKTAVDTFDKENEDKISLKLAGGDINMDCSLPINTLILKLMNSMKIDASSVGNHDFEGGNYWAQAMEKIKPHFKFLSSNLVFSKPNPVEDKIAKSVVIEKKGEKFGVIGVSPIDGKDLMYVAPFNEYIDILDFDKTVQSIKKEVCELERQGINKIFLLAHTGKESKDHGQLYERFAKLGGIDVIIGGHDHKEFDYWCESDRGEPVKIVSVGKADNKDILGEDLDSFGVLKTVFDENGVLIPEECKNDFKLSRDYPVNDAVCDMEEEYLHSRQVITKSSCDMTCSNRKTQENPVADLAADAMLWVVNKDTNGDKAQIAFVNSGGVRSELNKGDITIGMIRQALPFTSKVLIKTTLTKEKIIETLNVGSRSLSYPKVEPGLMQVGGLSYTVGKDGLVKDVYLLNEDGSLGEKIDEQPDDKLYTVVYDSFLLTGVAGLQSMKKDSNDPSIETFSHTPQDALIEYLSQNYKDKAIESIPNRIKFE